MSKKMLTKRGPPRNMTKKQGTTTTKNTASYTTGCRENHIITTAEKEDDTDFTADITTATFTSTEITAGKEDGADSTATMTTTAFISVCKWNGISTSQKT